MEGIRQQKNFVTVSKHLPLLVIITVACLLRFWLVLDTGLRIGFSVDELQSVVHAYLPLQDLLQSVAKFDPHPPLYYLQLHYWMTMGSSDLWLQMNSIALSILTIISLYATSKMIFDKRVAIIAALLLAVSPFSVAFALEVRMYAMLALLGVWQWFFTHRFVTSNRPYLTGIGLLISSVAILYTHGAASLLWMGSILYGSSLLLAAPNKQMSRWRNWFVLQVVIFALSFPWLFKARFIELNHLLRPDFHDVAYSLTQLLFGIKSVLLSSSEILLISSALVFALICLAILREQQGRRVLIAYVLAPIFAAIAISYVVKPIWVSRTLAFTSPFLYLAFALTVSSWMLEKYSKKARMAWIMLGLLAVFSLAGAVYQNLNFRPWSNLKESVAYVRKEVTPGDIIYVPNERIYWGFNWYFSGPGSVDPKQTDYELIVNGVPVVGGTAIERSLADGQRYWVISRNTDGAGLLDSYEGKMRRETMANYRNVTVELIELLAPPQDNSPS